MYTPILYACLTIYLSGFMVMLTRWPIEGMLRTQNGHSLMFTVCTPERFCRYVVASSWLRPTSLSRRVSIEIFGMVVCVTRAVTDADSLSQSTDSTDFVNEIGAGNRVELGSKCSESAVSRIFPSALSSYGKRNCISLIARFLPGGKIGELYIPAFI